MVVGKTAGSDEQYIVHPLTRLIDRRRSVSSMAGTFSEEKLLAYIDGTGQYVLPQLRRAKAF